LTPYVQCRTINNPATFGYTHCALRIKNDDIDVLIELIPENDKNEIFWRSAEGEGESGAGESRYDPNGWSQVQRPEGVSEEAFDRRILTSAFHLTSSQRGKPYSARGEKNSNHFVYTTLQRAGAKPPQKAVKGHGSPGLCGGSGTDTGNDCSP
jgi:hypothetical protein